MSPSNTSVYCALRSGYDMVVPMKGTLDTYQPSIDRVSAADIKRAFQELEGDAFPRNIRRAAKKRGHQSGAYSD